MRGVRPRGGERGLAVLEASVGAVIALPLLLAVLATVRLLGLSMRTSELVESILRADTTIPLHLSTIDGGVGEIVLDREGVERRLGVLLGDLEREILAVEPELSPESYRIDGALALITIDRTTGGASLGNSEIYRGGVGGLVPSGAELGSSDPGALVVKIADVTTSGGGAATIARESPVEEGAFLPYAVLIVVRVVRHLNDGVWGEVGTGLGLSPYLITTDSQLVRTEVSL